MRARSRGKRLEFDPAIACGRPVPVEHAPAGVRPHSERPGQAVRDHLPTQRRALNRVDSADQCRSGFDDGRMPRRRERPVPMKVRQVFGQPTRALRAAIGVTRTVVPQGLGQGRIQRSVDPSHRPQNVNVVVAGQFAADHGSQRRVVVDGVMRSLCSLTQAGRQRTGIQGHRIARWHPNVTETAGYRACASALTSMIQGVTWKHQVGGWA